MSNKSVSKAQESFVAKYLGWKVVSGSGARDFHPGDVEGDQWLGECKTHIDSNNRIVFYRNHWDKIVEEANSKFKYPILITDTGGCKPNEYSTWVLFNGNLVIPSNCVVETSTLIKTGANIRFSEEELRHDYHVLVSVCNTKNVVFRATWKQDTNIFIVPLFAFKEMMGGI